MKKLITICLVGAMALGFGIVSAANATVVVGGYSFDDNAFADYLISSSGSYLTSGGSLESCVTGANVNTWAGSWSSGAYLDLGFSDNYLVNGPGNDLALFDLGVEATFEVSVTIGGTTYLYDTFYTGYSGAGYNLNLALVNLDDFGLAAGTLLSHIVIGMDNLGHSDTPPALAVAGALNSIPEPATVTLLGLGALSLIHRKRRV
jgi:hypothetical protein